MNQRLLALGDCKSCDLAYIAQGEGSAEVDEFIMAIGFLNNKTEVAALLDGGSHVLMVSVLDDVEFPLERQRAGRKVGRFNASAKTDSIDAQVLSPTVELVDKDKADGALYIIHFGEGSYSTIAEHTKYGEGNDEGNESSFKKFTIRSNGWELAFNNSTFVPVHNKIPEKIVKQVPLPGGYSVQQLIIKSCDINRFVQLDPGRSIRFKDKDNIDATELES
ncbi:MAG: hypothetical protein LQ339_006413 [Xanthoria mediterranea]|nr:MAG: hypothetical protein LQ339_006413 [Xanthoria mediterranea]